MPQWAAVANALSAGSISDNKQAERFNAALSSSGDARLTEYLSVFLTGAQAPRKVLVTKAFGKTQPDLEAMLNREADRLGNLIERRKAILLRDRTQSLLVIAAAVAENYRIEKQERGLLDYDDLIDRTLAMLSRNNASASDLFYVDGGHL